MTAQGLTEPDTNAPGRRLNGRLLTISALSEEIGIPVRRLRNLYTANKIPFIKPGLRTLLFDPAKVLAALNKFEVKAVA